MPSSSAHGHNWARKFGGNSSGQRSDRFLPPGEKADRRHVVRGTAGGEGEVAKPYHWHRTLARLGAQETLELTHGTLDTGCRVVLCSCTCTYALAPRVMQLKHAHALPPLAGPPAPPRIRPHVRGGVANTISIKKVKSIFILDCVIELFRGKMH